MNTHASSRTALNLTLDLLLFVAMLGLTATGLLLSFALPAGTGRFHTLLGMTRHEMGTWHFTLSLVFLVALTVHLALHWSWVCKVVCQRIQLPPPSPRTRLRAGAALALALLLAFGVSGWSFTGLVRSASPQLSAEGSDASPALYSEAAIELPTDPALGRRLGSAGPTRRQATEATHPMLGPGQLRRSFGPSLRRARHLACR